MSLRLRCRGSFLVAGATGLVAAPALQSAQGITTYGDGTAPYSTGVLVGGGGPLYFTSGSTAGQTAPGDLKAGADLDARLGDPGFRAQVSLEAARGAPVEYTGYAFTPVPYGPSTPRGMPPEWEAYAEADSGHVVVNVPPTLPFKAGMGKDGVPGSRVCAIYRVTGAPGSAP